MNVICNMTKEASFILNGIYVGERPFISDFPNAFSDQASYFIMNAKLMYKWKPFNVYITVNNLTNKEYAEFGVIGGVPLEKAFYPSPTRTFLAGLSIDF